MRVEVSGVRQMPQQPLHKPLVNALPPRTNVRAYRAPAQTRYVHKKNRQVGVFRRGGGGGGGGGVGQRQRWGWGEGL